MFWLLHRKLGTLQLSQQWETRWCPCHGASQRSWGKGAGAHGYMEGTAALSCWGCRQAAPRPRFSLRGLRWHSQSVRTRLLHEAVTPQGSPPKAPDRCVPSQPGRAGPALSGRAPAHSRAPTVPRGRAGERRAGRGAVNHGRKSRALHNRHSRPARGRGERWGRPPLAHTSRGGRRQARRGPRGTVSSRDRAARPPPVTGPEGTG